ncbi:NYN domain-containing protein [Aquihabitans daechungensis]|uniref:NYN domain-containing protein n=1 Tax=Aquihabitans daechungensis TaxID=1052257 RepID=UPI003BA0BD29
MRRIRSALYLDFDNILSGLLKADRSAAEAWLDDPGALVDRLSSLDHTNGVRRDLLVRRAYLNPNGTVPNPDVDIADRIPLAQYRSALTKAGFEVVDCPRLGKGLKNAADIRMVIDVLEAMAGPVPYEEVIIASSDADFTPLLVKLRANDRRTMILVTGDAADAYRTVADRCMDESELVALLSPGLALVAEPPSTKAVSPDSESQARKALVALVRSSPDPVALSAAGLVLRREVGTDLVNDTKWFGHRTLTRFVQERVTNLEVDTANVWDPARHPAHQGS